MNIRGLNIKKIMVITLVLSAMTILTVNLLTRTYVTDNHVVSVNSKVNNHPSNNELLLMVNSERQKNGVDPLVLDPKLEESASYKAKDMYDRHYFGHPDPATAKNNGIDKAFELEGSKCTFASENLTQNTVVNDSSHAVNAWLDSSTHREAMLNPKFKSTGFGIAGNYIVEHFCQY